MTLKDLIPLLVIQGTFQLIALGHLIYKKQTRNLNPWFWAGIIIFEGIFGPIFYFAFGKSED